MPYNGERPGGNVSDGEEIPRRDVTYDLRGVEPGEVVRIVTDQGTHELVKMDDLGIQEGWMHNGERVSVTILEGTRSGSSYSTSSSVARASRSHEIGLNYIDRKPLREAVTTHNLGRVAWTADALAAEQ